MTQNIPENAVQTINLSKVYAPVNGVQQKPALNGVSLEIPRGSFFGLLGPNGAGKSTLINILAGLVIRSSGQALIWDYDIEKDMRAARRCIGIVPQELNVDPFFTPRESLELQAGLYGVPSAARRTDEILDAVGLLDKADVYSRTLSGGMRRRLLVAKAMVHSPPVLVLDEPTAGVDVSLRRQLWSYVRELNAMGTTVLLTTHYLEEAEELCDSIAIIDQGNLITCESTSALLRRLDAKEITVTIGEELAQIPEALKRYNVELQNGPRLRFCYPPSKTNSGEILSAIQDAGLSVTDVVTKEAELEDIFLSLTSPIEHGKRA
ncbi:MAG: ABC transporter ATP-binding protein [Rhodospirillales bacterium]|nr:ABC transporter ATP-binding protein [Rhodospirillales bacterium]